MDQNLIAKANVINYSFYNTLKGYMWKLQTLQIKNEAIIYFESALYPLFQNGCHFSVLLFACKLALVVSLKGNYSFEFSLNTTQQGLICM